MQEVFDDNSLEYQFIERTANAHSRRARRLDMVAFVETYACEGSNRSLPSSDFLRLPQAQAVEMLNEYQGKLLAKKLAPATTNRRLATMRAWVRFAHELGLTRLSSDNLIGEMASTVSSRELINAEERARLCTLPNTQTPVGKRDAAMLHLLCEVPLLGWQICAIRVNDFNYTRNKLRIPVNNVSEYAKDSKNRNPEAERKQSALLIKLSAQTSEKIQTYLSQNNLPRDKESSLFGNFDRRPQYQGIALVPKSILHLVKGYGKKAKIENLNVRTLRTSAIIKTLEEAEWKISAAFQRFPHVGFHTWVRYCSLRSEVCD